MSLFFKPRLPDTLGQDRLTTFLMFAIAIVCISFGLGLGRVLWHADRVNSHAVREAWRTNAVTNPVPPEAKP